MGLSPETNPALPVAEAAGEQAPAEEGDLPDASPVPEFTVEVTAASDVSRGPADIARTPESTPGISKPAPAVAAKAARASDLKHLDPVQKRKGKLAPSKPEAFVPPGEGQDSTIRGLFPRQSQKPAPASTESENLPGSQGDELKPTAILASQALRIGMGAAAGAALVLALVVGVPFLRTAVQATANARSAASNPASSPAFQVEVADLNDRRWILAPHSKLPSPGVLALSRPHPKQAEASSAQLIAPSIFDGITPPIGSLSDRLPASGPAAPGVVQPESQSGVRNSALQSAVLLQRIAPIYPGNALESRLQGQVLVNATIGRDGIPKDLKIIKGDERLVAAALAAIRQWRYRPAMLGGQPIETQTVVTISFEIK